MCGVNITKHKNSLHCIGISGSAGYKLKLLDQLYFHPWRLSDIPVAAGFISYLFSFEPEHIYFFSFRVH